MRRKCPGLKRDTEAMDARKRVVEEQCVLGRSRIERICGLYTRENAGMSSETHARNMGVEGPRFPGEGSSTQGKSGAKLRTEVVGDAQQVHIPALPRNDAVTQKDSLSRVMVNPVQAPRLTSSEVRLSKG